MSILDSSVEMDTVKFEKSVVFFHELGLGEGIPHGVRELWERSPISPIELEESLQHALEEWTQHAVKCRRRLQRMQTREKPRSTMSVKELMNLITKSLPSKIEELLQLENARKRLKEELVSLKDKKRMREKTCQTLGWFFDMRQVEFVEKQIKLAEEQMYLECISDMRREFVDEQIKLTEKRTYFDTGDGAVSDILYPILEKMIFEYNHNALNVLEKFHSRYPRDLKIFQLLEKIKRILGCLLGVVVLFIYQYLMGYVETGRWNTYSNGAWDFRATYVCIELRLGSYPFQKFRETPRKFSGVTKRTYDTRNGVIYKYEPWVRFRKPKFYFEGQKTAEKAARIRDVAKFWLKINGRNPYNFGEEDYNYLNFVQEFHPQQSDDEIKRLVLEHAQPFLKEVQQSQVPIVYQPPYVEPARFANGEHIDNTIQEFLPSDSDEINNMIQELRDADEQATDTTEEPQSVSANLESAGPTIEENIREHREALISSAGPSLIQSGCTSQITLLAPCDGTGAVNLFTELKVFRKENWNAKTGAGATSSCALEGCSAAMHEFTFLQKSGENQELWPENIWAKLDAFEDRGWKIDLLGNGRRALISSAGPSLIQSGCTSQITLIPPCDGTGAVNDLFTELKVFRKENWKPKTGAGATSSCALEGCSSTVHEFLFLQKSGENQELWPVDIWAKLDAFEDHGWKIELLENGRRAT